MVERATLGGEPTSRAGFSICLVSRARSRSAACVKSYPVRISMAVPGGRSNADDRLVNRPGPKTSPTPVRHTPNEDDTEESSPSRCIDSLVESTQLISMSVPRRALLGGDAPSSGPSAGLRAAMPEGAGLPAASRRDGTESSIRTSGAELPAAAGSTGAELPAAIGALGAELPAAAVPPGAGPPAATASPRLKNASVTRRRPASSASMACSILLRPAALWGRAAVPARAASHPAQPSV